MNKNLTIKNKLNKNFKFLNILLQLQLSLI